MIKSGWEGSGSTWTHTGELLEKRSPSLSGSPDGPGQFLGAQTCSHHPAQSFECGSFASGAAYARNGNVASDGLAYRCRGNVAIQGDGVSSAEQKVGHYIGWSVAA